MKKFNNVFFHSIVKKYNLSEQQLDSVNEVASIGMSHAANALSKMLNRSVYIIVPKVEFLDVHKVADAFFNNKEEVFVGVYLRILGKVTGHLLILFDKKSALSIVDILMNRKSGSTKVFADIEQSCLMETGAILTASCLNALASFLKMTLIPSVPHFIFDHGEFILNGVLQELDLQNFMGHHNTEYTFVINSDFKTKENEIKGKFFIFPDEDSLLTIWKTFNVG